VDIIFKYFNNLSDEQKDRFSELKDLYTDWNSKINVISRKDIDELYTRHVYILFLLLSSSASLPDPILLMLVAEEDFPEYPWLSYFQM
jgi:16S rRNA (guanine527-N7)-methyltransferase